jgi:hypothetical protein
LPHFRSLVFITYPPLIVRALYIQSINHAAQEVKGFLHLSTFQGPESTFPAALSGPDSLSGVSLMLSGAEASAGEVSHKEAHGHPSSMHTVKVFGVDQNELRGVRA